MGFAIVVLTCLAFAAAAQTPLRCRRGQPCWPKPEEIDAFAKALGPQLDRNLHWKGGLEPRPAPVPLYSPGQQPLYGMNTNMKPLYVQEPTDDQTSACPQPWSSDVCKAGTRNSPKEGWNPAFVAFPLTAAHVQTAVRFAKKHNLCVAVAGTGHDFMNRHSCNDGLLIRTTLLKDMDWSLNGAVKLGAGLTFQEVDKAASIQNPSVFTACGWSATVGVAGWSLGGGHGPFGASKGLGVDNILEVELVLANGSLVTANAEENKDLFWALRGGGGSTWGVMTAITVRKHLTPPGGITSAVLSIAGSMCNEGEGYLNRTIDAYLDWSAGLDNRWSGLTMLLPQKQLGKCPSWTALIVYTYLGANTTSDYKAQVGKLTDALAGLPILSGTSTTYANWYEKNIPTKEEGATDGIDPFQVKADGSHLGGPSHGDVGTKYFFTPTGVPSVLLTGESMVSKTLRSKYKETMLSCKKVGLLGTCDSLEFYHDIPGTRQPFPANSTSISPSFRTANVHLVVGTGSSSVLDDYYQFGTSSYFNEAAYNMSGTSWKQRYWGENYERLLNIKKTYDPDNLFWCHQCVGSDEPGKAMPELIV